MKSALCSNCTLAAQGPGVAPFCCYTFKTSSKVKLVLIFLINSSTVFDTQYCEIQITNATIHRINTADE